MANKRQIAETFYPGVFLEEELDARGWSQVDLAEILGKSSTDINLIIKGKRSITPEMAIALGDAFDTGAELWMNLETQYQLSNATYKQTDVSLKAKLYDKFPVREMVKRGWIETSTNIDVLVSRFCEFFEIPDLDAAPNFNHAAKKSTSYAVDTNASQNAWLFRARKLAKAAFMQNKFTLARLKICFEKLRLLLHETEEIRHIPKIMSETGIRFIIVETMPKSKIDGATFWLDDDSPVVVMSLSYDRIDNFWFTLMHELSHVKHGEGKTEAIIDVDLFSETSNEKDKPEFEIRADNEAAEFCISSTALENFILRTHPYYLEAKLKGFALVNKTHPGIVAGQLQRRKRIPYSHHRKLLVKVRDLILGSAFTDGFGYIPQI